MPEVTCPKCQQGKDEGEFRSRNGQRQYYACQQCRRTYGREWMRSKRRPSHAAVWESLLDAMGHHCRRCGYSEFSTALQFHPIVERDAHPDVLLSNMVNRYAYGPTGRLWADLMLKLEAHILLCCNCRQALRAGEWDIDATNRTYIGPVVDATPPTL